MRVGKRVTSAPWLPSALVTTSLLLIAALVNAQSAPVGPAQVISGARAAREKRELEQATQRGSKPAAQTGQAAQAARPAPSAQPAEPAPSAAPPAKEAPPMQAAPTGEAAVMPDNPHAGLGGDNPHAGDAGNQAPQIASQHADTALPTGSIHVRVLDPRGVPAPNAQVTLGIMASDNKHSSLDARTGPDGTLTFSDQPGGDKQAYRVNAPYQGAKYSSTPFRLPLQGGYQVEIHQLPVTHDARMVVLYVGATSIELKDDRIKIVQQARLMNLGGATYVFPQQGTLVRFPKGFMAVQTDEVMTDQHVVEAKNEGVRVHGSLPPGEATLLWGFDLPLEGSQASFTVGIPWLTFAYRVIADAPPGMRLHVAGMPDPELHDEDGRRLYLTEIQQRVGDTRFGQLRVTLSGIPGPGPERWFAAAFALVALIAGVWFSRRPSEAARAPGGSELRDIEARKAELLERARELESQRQSGEIGPQYHAEQLDAVRDELAALLLTASHRGQAAQVQARTSRPG